MKVERSYKKIYNREKGQFWPLKYSLSRGREPQKSSKDVEGRKGYKMRKRTEKRSEPCSKNENCFSLLSLTLLLFKFETGGK